MPTQAWLGRQYDWMFMFISMWHACYEDVWEPNHDPNTLSTTAPLEAFGCPTWERETRRWSVGIARAHARGGCDSAGIEATPSTHEGTAGVHVCREHGREPTGVKRHRALHASRGRCVGRHPMAGGRVARGEKPSESGTI